MYVVGYVLHCKAVVVVIVVWNFMTELYITTTHSHLLRSIVVRRYCAAIYTRLRERIITLRTAECYRIGYICGRVECYIIGNERVRVQYSLSPLYLKPVLIVGKFVRVCVRRYLECLYIFSIFT
jgi:hypothetical protein